MTTLGILQLLGAILAAVGALFGLRRVHQAGVRRGRELGRAAGRVEEHARQEGAAGAAQAIETAAHAATDQKTGADVAEIRAETTAKLEDPKPPTKRAVKSVMDEVKALRRKRR